MKLSTMVCVIVLVCGACTGPMGPAGEDGEDGIAGLDGADGTNGTDGAPGSVGPRGAQGPKGADGANGADGKPGRNGEDGSPSTEVPEVFPTYRPTLWVDCTSTLDLDSDGLAETFLNYAVTKFSNSDVNVDCRAQDITGTKYYPGITNGGNVGACSARVDLSLEGIPVNSVGFWSFSMLGGPHATYSDIDPDHPFTGFTYSFLTTECAAFELSDELTWTRITPSW